MKSKLQTEPNAAREQQGDMVTIITLKNQRSRNR